MPSPNSMATSGKAATLRFVKTVSPGLLVVSVVVVASAAAAVVSEVGLLHVEASVGAATLEAVSVGAVASREEVEGLPVVPLAAVLASTLALVQTRRTRSQTSLLLEVNRAARSTFATCHGLLAMRISLSSSLRLARLHAPKSSMSPTVAPVELVSLSLSRSQMLRLPSVSDLVLPFGY
jgi:hypothetical protein